MLSHLKSIYGYNDFRSHQKDVIEDVLKGENTIVVFPTGQGKSLCYQFPATYSNKTSIVISPLISLMEDQKLNLEKKGIKSMCLNSVDNHIQNKKLLKMSISSPSLNVSLNVSIIYTTPEFFTSNIIYFKSIIENICLIAIDEAHCLSAWGHDFRPSYKKLNIISTEFLKKPIMLLTATATPLVLEDIFNTIGITEANEYNIGTKRSNLYISILKKTNISKDLDVIDVEKSTIIYTQTRKKAEEVCSVLVSKGIMCEFYHAGMSNEERNIIHKRFSSNELKVLVATICFGMGIDKPDIRMIINWGAPCDIETYYQEIGRGGRDGLDSKVIMFYDESDFRTNQYLISKSSQNEYRNNMLNIFKKYIENIYTCRQNLIEEYFEFGNITYTKSKELEKCNNCDNCNRKIIKGVDITKEGKIILDFIKSLQLKYGISKVIETLHGSKSSKLGSVLLNTSFNGIFNNLSKDYIKDIINLLIQKDFLENTIYDKMYTVVGIGSRIMKDDTIIEINHIKYTPKIKEDNTFLKYCDIRLQIANENKVSPYMIINDAVLENISRVKPSTLEEMVLIDGVNLHFISNYGFRFLLENKKIIKCNSTAEESFKLFNNNKNINEISKIRNIKRMTVEKHIVEYLKNHKSEINYKMFNITDDIKNIVLEAVSNVGKSKLKPIKEIVGHKISYLQIQICLI